MVSVARGETIQQPFNPGYYWHFWFNQMLCGIDEAQRVLSCVVLAKDGPKAQRKCRFGSCLVFASMGIKNKTNLQKLAAFGANYLCLSIFSGGVNECDFDLQRLDEDIQ